MTWKIFVGVLVLPYLVAMYMTATLNLDSNVENLPEDQQALIDLLNAAGQPYEVNINQPTIGTDTPITMSQVYPTTVTGWVGFAANAAALRGTMWEPWTTPIRIFILAMGFSALLFLTIMAFQTFGFLIGGVMGATTTALAAAALAGST